MDFNLEKKEIRSNKILNELDKFMIDFANILEKHTSYVIVSGYVSILLGRSRASEDIDLLIPEINLNNFIKMFEDLLLNGYECANTSNSKEAFDMFHEHAIRFYKKIPVPNIEFKLITNNIQKIAFDDRIKVILKDKILYISPLELQIAYKLHLIAPGNFDEVSSDKDFEDAKHLYELFKDKLNKDKLLCYVNLLKVGDKFEWLKK